MTTIKMKYGIDLGTTNSALCKLDNGVPTIIKTDTLKDTLPSCVAFTGKKVIKVGDSAYNNNRSDKSRATKKWNGSSSNVFLEFKRTMGLDKKYYSSNMGRDYSSEELSAEVLKTLMSFNNEKISSTIITIPAKFKTDQIAATKRAAELAGIEHCELLQEPIAAAMAYGLNAEKSDGKWLVFDFGGGTFDAALLNVEDGILQVKDTEGDNYLGGKNLDYAIVDEILIPYLQDNYSIDSIIDDDQKRNILRDALKFYAEYAKNQLSFKKEIDITSQLDEFGTDDEDEELELDLIITEEDIKDVVTPVFQKAVDICRKLLERNNLSGSSLDSLILVGGPTRSPVLREMLRNQITENVNTNIDPMTAIAVGAALYASTVDTDWDFAESKDCTDKTVEFDLQYESNTVDDSEFVAIKINENSQFKEIYVDLERNDKAWSSGKTLITTEGDVMECRLLKNKPNSFKIRAYDASGNSFDSFPAEISIIHGTKIGSAVLPYNIGIEVNDEYNDKDVFIPIKGLEKNQPLPAVGVRNGLYVPHAITAGSSSDSIIIPIYQGEYNSEGTNAIYNDHVFDVIIEGKDLSASVPDKSQIDITIKVDRSQMMIMEVQLLATGETIEKNIEVSSRKCIDSDHIRNLSSQITTKISEMKQNSYISSRELSDAEKKLNDVQNRLDSEISSDDGKMHLLSDIRKIFIDIDKIAESHQSEILNEKISQLLDKIEKCNEILGSTYDQNVRQAQELANKALINTSIGKKREYLKELENIHTKITFKFQTYHIAKHISENFDTFNWKDRQTARAIVNRVEMLLIESPFSDEMIVYMQNLVKLMNMSEAEKLKLLR